MKKVFKHGVFALVMLLILASCKKEQTLNANLDLIDQNISAKTSTDKWLEDNFLTPYNIQVKYKYDRFELALGKSITPPIEMRVIPAMEMVRDIWIKPYEKVGGPDFIKKISPKQFVLAGSAEFNNNGTITLGTAEGGRKIVLYVINSFDKTDLNSVKRMIQTIQHEYAHILNQVVDFQPDYQTISRGGYEANWTQRPIEEAYQLGFITQYARVSPGEDFAEQVANMLMMGPVRYNGVVALAPAEGQAKIKKKEAYVVEYFKTAFNIDFYQLQAQVQNELNKISPPILHQMLGAGIGYTSLYSKPSSDPQQSSEFLTLWNTAKRLMQAQQFLLNDFKLIFKTDSEVTLRYSFDYAGSTYLADADYGIQINPFTGVAKFTLSATQPTTANYANMDFINTYMTSVNRYFQLNEFTIDWFNKIPGTIGNIGSLGGFYKTTNPSSYFYGVMGH